MALIRNAANTIRKGRVGETTYYVSGGQQIARQARNDSNFGETARRSEAQQSRRILWANLVNFYKVSSTWMPKSFETKKRNQSDYNKFMAVNIGNSSIALTREESAAGACIAAPYIVSQGSLPSIEIVQLSNQWRTNLAIGQLQIDDDTTNAQLTAALESSNAHVRAGMQLSFVSYQQSVDPLGTPRLICRCYEITLSRTSSDVVRDYLPEFCSQTVQGYLGTNNEISVGAFAYILSDLVTGGLKVSTQQLVSTNSELISQYSSAEHIAEAVESYGLDKEVILSPTGTVMQSAEAQPIYIEYVKYDNKTIYQNDYLGPNSVLKGKSVSVMMSSSKGSVSSALVRSKDGTTATFASVTKSGKTVTAVGGSSWASSSPIVAIELSYADGTIVTIPFRSDSSVSGGDI